jgi:membrane-bound lytic murein transglycosylase D
MSKHTFILILFCSLLSKPLLAETPPFELNFDELKWEVEQLECIVEPHYNKTVQAYLNRYLKTGRSYSARMIGRTDIYFPIFEAYLKKEELPEDLKYLPIVESALNPNGTSRVGAQGLWQFMPSTAPEFGMKISQEVDERMDTNLATMGALKYLKKAYERFQSWELALASYNAGPGRVNRAVKRARSTKFSRVKRYLPRETQNYIPAFIAATFLMKNFEKYELVPHPQELDLVLTETVVLTNQMNFELVKRITGVNIATLKRLNPSYINEVIPYKEGGALLILPLRTAQAIYDYQKMSFFNKINLEFEDDNIQILDQEITQNEKYIKTHLQLSEALPMNQLAEQLGVSKHILTSWNPAYYQLDTLQGNSKLFFYSPKTYVRYDETMWSIVPYLPSRAPKGLNHKAPYSPKKEVLGVFTVKKNNTIFFTSNRTIKIDRLLQNYNTWNKSFILRKNKLKPGDLIEPSREIRIK